MRLQRRARTIALAGVSVLGFAAQANAGEAGGTVPITALTAGEVENVIVTGFLEEDLPQRLSQIGTRVDVVPGTVIANGGYVDVSQALTANVPGLYIASRSGPFDYVDVSLQGSRTSDILWTVDGVRINNRLYAGTTPLDTLPSSFIERIEVLEGPQSLFYGTQGIAGAINIVTLSFSDERQGAIKIGGDTHGGYHTEGFFRDSVDGHQFVVYGAVNVSEGFHPFPEKDMEPSLTDRNRGYELYTIGGKYAYRFNDRLRFSLTEEHTEGRVDFIFAPTWVADVYNNRKEDILTAKIDYTLSEQMQFFLKGYYHWWHSEYTDIENDVFDINGKVIGQSVYDDHDFWGFDDYGINAMGKFTPAPGVDTYLGYDFQAYHGNDAVLVIDDKAENVHALFGAVMTNRDLWQNFQLAAGFRYNAASEGRDATVWNVSARFDLSEQFYVKGLVGTGFRLPTAEELFANDLCGPGCGERGNPNTKPEESINVNASVGGQFMDGMIRWEAIGFYRQIDNMIGLVDYDFSTDQDVFGNLPGRIDVTGGEFVLDAAVTDELSGNFNFTVSRSESDVTGQQINRVPQALVKFTVDYHPMAVPFGAFATFNYVGKAYDSVGGVRVSYGDYPVVDLGLRAFFDQDRKHRIDLGVHNLFDEDYATRVTRVFPDDGGPTRYTHFLGLPRQVYVSYGYSF